MKTYYFFDKALLWRFSNDLYIKKKFLDFYINFLI